jgi:LPXTG-motif cell wall-anchored protein
MADLRRLMNAGKLARLEVKMFSRLSLAVVLSASLSFAQVAVVGGTATTAGPAMATVPVSAANAPLISTPDIALPGSGSAMGAPISAAAANDSRSSSGPSVYNPNGTPFAVPEPTSSNLAAVPSTANPAGATTATASGAAATPTEPFGNGIQHFESGLPNTSNQTQSLGQIARAYRSHRPQDVKSFNNDSIAELNARGVRTGNLGPETSTVVASSQPATQPAQPTNGGTLMAQNQAPALPQSDQNQAAASTPPAASSSTAWQQRHKPSEQNASSSAQTSGAAQQQISTAQNTPAANENTAKKETSALPQTGSPLPLLLLLGGLGVVGGLVYWLRR